MKRRAFITLLGGRGCRVAARGARSRRGSRRPSGTWEPLRLPPKVSGSLLLCSGCASSAGSKVASHD
jgi:hypothetical protein